MGCGASKELEPVDQNPPGAAPPAAQGQQGRPRPAPVSSESSPDHQRSSDPTSPSPAAVAAARSTSNASVKNNSGNRVEDGMATLDALPPVNSSWRCKQHGAINHRYFLNYRVATDAPLAEMTAFALQASRQENTVFLDRHCLVDGEDWESGFLNGLRSSKAIVLLISEAAIEGIKNAHKWGDNVLLEYECALALAERGDHLLLPVLIGKYVQVEGSELYKKFSAFGAGGYSDEPHAHARSHVRSVKALMQQLFKLQGIFADPRNMNSVVSILNERTDAFIKRKQQEQRDKEMAEARAKRESARAARREARGTGDVASVDTKTAEDLGSKLNSLCYDKRSSLRDIEDLLKRGADPDFKKGVSYGYTPLHQAVYYGTPEMVALLLQYGADEQIQDTSQYTPEALAKYYGKTAALKVFREFRGESASHEALGEDIECSARNNDVPALKEAIAAARAAGVLAKAVNTRGPSWEYTGLHYAAYCGYAEVCKLLVDAGADLTLKEYSGSTALDLAKSYSMAECVAILEGK